jgi:N-acetylmuramoyl-L-alanine amidase
MATLEEITKQFEDAFSTSTGTGGTTINITPTGTTVGGKKKLSWPEIVQRIRDSQGLSSSETLPDVPSGLSASSFYGTAAKAGLLPSGASTFYQQPFSGFAERMSAAAGQETPTSTVASEEALSSTISGQQKRITGTPQEDFWTDDDIGGSLSSETPSAEAVSAGANVSPLSLLTGGLGGLVSNMFGAMASGTPFHDFSTWTNDQLSNPSNFGPQSPYSQEQKDLIDRGYTKMFQLPTTGEWVPTDGSSTKDSNTGKFNMNRIDETFGVWKDVANKAGYGTTSSPGLDLPNVFGFGGDKSDVMWYNSYSNFDWSTTGTQAALEDEVGGGVSQDRSVPDPDAGPYAPPDDGGSGPSSDTGDTGASMDTSEGESYDWGGFYKSGGRVGMQDGSSVRTVHDDHSGEFHSPTWRDKSVGLDETMYEIDQDRLYGDQEQAEKSANLQLLKELERKDEATHDEYMAAVALRSLDNPYGMIDRVQLLFDLPPLSQEQSDQLYDRINNKGYTSAREMTADMVAHWPVEESELERKKRYKEYIGNVYPKKKEKSFQEGGSVQEAEMANLGMVNEQAAAPQEGGQQSVKDDIPREADEGDYILPYETVLQVGLKQLNRYAKEAIDLAIKNGVNLKNTDLDPSDDVPIKISNYEYHIPKGLVPYFGGGKKYLDKIRNEGLALRKRLEEEKQPSMQQQQPMEAAPALAPEPQMVPDAQPQTQQMPMMQEGGFINDPVKALKSAEQALTSDSSQPTQSAYNQVQALERARVQRQQPPMVDPSGKVVQQGFAAPQGYDLGGDVIESEGERLTTPEDLEPLPVTQMQTSATPQNESQVAMSDLSKKTLFDQAFKKSRAEGKQEFELDGKRYGTNTREEVQMMNKFKNLEPYKMMALVALGEARSEGPAGMQAVMHVINNRANANRSQEFGGTDHRSVMLHKNAFSALRGYFDPKERKNFMTFMKVKTDDKWYKQAEKDAKAILNGELEDITNGALYYYNPDKVEKPKYLQGKERKRLIGSHAFFSKGGFVDRVVDTAI